MTRIKIAAAQYPISRHSSLDGWRQHVGQWIERAVKNQAKVLMFPEYGAMELASILDAECHGDLSRQVQELAKIQDAYTGFFAAEALRHQVMMLAPSFPALKQETKKVMNRAFCFFPDGSFDFQDKEHMTRTEDELWGWASGESEMKVFSAFGVRFGVNICFDVEFPFAAHHLARKGVQVLLVPSCTKSLRGMNRVHIGAKARALENQFYVVVAQVVGEASWLPALDVSTGMAAFYSTCDVGFPDDGVLATGEINQPQWLYCELDLTLIERVRTKGEVFNFRHMDSNRFI